MTAHHAPCLYLDHAATTPVRPEVLEAMWPYHAEHFGNAASRNHGFGWTAAEAVDLARERVAQLIGAEPGEIVFTSGATEAINTAIKGVGQAYARKGQHMVAVQTEHKAVLDVLARWTREGQSQVPEPGQASAQAPTEAPTETPTQAAHQAPAIPRSTLLPVDGQGTVSMDALDAAIGEQSVLVACMAGNNETGVQHPIARIAERVHAKGSLLLVDATQAAGKVPLDVQAMGADLLAISAHKFGGPKGVGALYVRRRNPRVRMMPLLDGGGHEGGRRSGTLNVPGIVGLGKAAELAVQELPAYGQRLGALREKLEALAQAQLGAQIHGGASERLPHISNLYLPQLAEAGQKAEQLLARVQSRLAASTASACSSADLSPSHVLLAMGCSPQAADASIRLSLGWNSTEQGMEQAVSILKRGLEAMD